MTEITEELVLECTGEAHLGSVDTLLLRGNNICSLTGLATLNMPSLQTVLLSNNSIGPCLDGIQSVAHSLCSLNINNNSVEDLSPLRACVGLKSLFASCNRIRDIRSLQHCPHLAQLSLYANLLSSLEACVQTLASLPILSELDLGNNPCSFAEEYRPMLCVVLGGVSLSRLDGDPVTSLDCDLARQYYKEKNKELPVIELRPLTGRPITGMVERHSTAQSEVVPGDAQVLVIHGDGSPPAHKRSTVGEDWGLGADEGEEADDDNIGFLGEQPGITNTKLYENEALNEHPVLLQYLAEASLEDSAQGVGSTEGISRPRSFVQRLRKTAEVMEQAAALDTETLAAPRESGGERPSTAFRPSTPGVEFQRPGTAQVLDGVLGHRGASAGSSWADAEPRETIRQLLRVVTDLKAELRSAKEVASQKVEPLADAGEMRHRIELLEAENANMYHLIEENRHLRAEVTA